MDAAPIRVPYRHLNDAELELVGLNGGLTGEIDDPGAGASSSRSAPSTSDSPSPSYSSPEPTSLKTLILGSMVGAGVQFGWALQLSLLTPYIQTLGVDHAFSSFIWLCGPITGFVVQPCVGIWSDKCHSKYGRRRPFIFAGCFMISVAVLLIGFSSDIGSLLGDTKENCGNHGSQKIATVVFIIGFWMLDLANNTVQGPARALLADLSGPDRCNMANAIFCSWMAFGNILGFSAGANGHWHRWTKGGHKPTPRWFPFLTTKACCEACGNLKGAFLVAVVFLMFCMLVTIHFAKEVPLEAIRTQRLADSAPLLTDAQQRSHGLSDANLGELQNGQRSETRMVVGESNSNGPAEFNSNVELHDDRVESFNDGPAAVLVNILTSLRHLPPGMHSVLLVMSLTWLSWFPFFLFDTDWMGREVFHGDPNGEANVKEAYHSGVREGAFGLLLNSVVLGACSFLIDPICRIMGARLVWAISNFVVFICMAATAIVSLYSNGIQQVIGGNRAVKVAALVIFSVLGLPLSVTYSVPFSVTAELTSGTGGGQGFATGVLNLAIVVPQMIVSLGAGPWDELFGGGNIPAFVLASVFSLAAGVVAVTKLPRLSSSYRSAGFHGFG